MRESRACIWSLWANAPAEQTDHVQGSDLSSPPALSCLTQTTHDLPKSSRRSCTEVGFPTDEEFSGHLAEGHRCMSRSTLTHGESLLGVLPKHLVDAADGRASDGGVVPVMVVGVQPAVKSTGSGRL